MSRKNRKQVFEQVEIIDAGAKGKAVGKAPDGKIIFIDNAVPGDIADIQTFKKRKAYYQGKAIHFHQLSSKRVDPVCEHFGVCGGCKWQNMSYEAQLFFKEKEVTNNLVRLGKLDIENTLPILGSKDQYFYRNKMEFTFSNNRWLTLDEIQSDKDFENKNALGFHIPGMWDKILDLHKCHLQEDPSNAIRDEVKAYAKANKLSFFDMKKQEGLLRTLMIRIASTGQIMVLVQFYEDDKIAREKLLHHIADTFPEITSLQYVINTKGNDTIYDQEVVCFRGSDYIMEEMEGLQFKINAKSFYQTNSKQAYELYKITRDFANLKGDEIVYDLYTGTGTIAQFVAQKAQKVVGVEAVPEAIEDAKENARNNQIENTVFYAGDMKNVFTQDFIEANGKPDVIITDPPRDGMHKDVVAQILRILPQRIVYVSCNSATQARDLAMMKEHYKITKSQAVDMFPQTHHIENVVCLELR
ncbi:23S rRNA (uracil(1939)-C(5))-methyltransferase RlmD [Mesonia sp. K7]|uniref:23S rRNA (uracil(1939)-C(5))-methyltransferase RlmD n=1 Tax=Mesonia sp. K7 TaxID=2218606 RepID=UPI000DAA8623|nr:23S rRNA (uracil(1939)-C(5))-methyltransferase RlmD [Mesonia sp. K7]PZD77035.1 23S rRNA (uracil(1939)-C(5))-methyltransferase RlmD [Mesonia sp. K7]